MKKIFCLLLVCIFLFVGCAGWRANTTNTYVATGFGLTATVNTVKPSCDKNTILIENCMKLRESYAIAYQAYVSSGNVLILALTAEDAVQKKILREQFNIILEQFRVASMNLIELIQQIQALQTNTKMPKAIVIETTTIQIILSAINALISIAPQIVSWVGDMATSEEEIQSLVKRIQDAQKAVPIW